MRKKIKLAEIEVQSFVTGQEKIGGYKAVGQAVGRVQLEGTEQTECYHCDSAGQGCSAPCN
jgi:hypothetical protein